MYFITFMVDRANYSAFHRRNWRLQYSDFKLIPRKFHGYLTFHHLLLY